MIIVSILSLAAVASAESELVGKTLVITYPGGYQYEVSYRAETLLWKATGGPELGRSEEDSYDSVKVKEGIYMVRWKESDGVVVHSLINLKGRTVVTSIMHTEFYDYLVGSFIIKEVSDD